MGTAIFAALIFAVLKNCQIKKFFYSWKIVCVVSPA